MSILLLMWQKSISKFYILMRWMVTNQQFPIGKQEHTSYNPIQRGFLVATIFSNQKFWNIEETRQCQINIHHQLRYHTAPTLKWKSCDDSKTLQHCWIEGKINYKICDPMPCIFFAQSIQALQVHSNSVHRLRWFRPHTFQANSSSPFISQKISILLQTIFHWFCKIHLDRFLRCRSLSCSLVTPAESTPYTFTCIEAASSIVGTSSQLMIQSSIYIRNHYLATPSSKFTSLTALQPQLPYNLL